MSVLTRRFPAPWPSLPAMHIAWVVSFVFAWLSSTAVVAAPGDVAGPTDAGTGALDDDAGGDTDAGTPMDAGFADDGTEDGGFVDAASVDGGAAADDVADDANGETIAWVQVAIDRPREDEEAELLTYLSPMIGRPATTKTVREAELWLTRLRRYQAAQCRLGEEEMYRGRLRCGVARARVVRTVDVEGLPLRLLQTDLEKRIFLRPGTPVDTVDTRGVSALERQRIRVIKYLERQGFYGATVDLLTTSDILRAEVDVTIRIRGGDFISVNNVVLEDAGPLDENTLKFAFQWMCIATDGLIDTYETLELSCLTDKQLRATRERMTALLKRSGYPEGRVRARVKPLDPLDEDTPIECRRATTEAEKYYEDGLLVPPRCAELSVKVTPGPLLITHVEVKDAPAVDWSFRVPVAGEVFQPAADFAYETLRALRTDFVETLSAIFQIALRGDLGAAEDSTVWTADLRKVLTFNDAATVDRVEAENARAAILNALQRRGYFNATVKMRYEEQPLGVIVNYDVYPGPVSAVGRVMLTGNDAFEDQAIFKEVTLATRQRTFGVGGFADGFVTSRDLDEDVRRIRGFYEARGYRDADVIWNGRRKADGLVEVEFHIDEGDAYKLGSLEIEGGDPALNIQVLKNIKHCEGGRAHEQGRPPLSPEDCIGAPFLPDEIQADEKRVLNTYVTKGFLYTKVAIEPTFTDDGPGLRIQIGTTLDDELSSVPGIVARGMVFVDGDDVTDRDVLLREFGNVDKVIRPEAVAAGVRRLRRTGLYSRVDLNYIGVAERGDKVHLEIDVEERPTWTWDASAAFSTNRYFSVRNEFRNRNVFGRMLDLSAVADVGLFVGRYSLLSASLRWPRVFSLPLSFKVTPALTYEDRPSTYIPREPATSGREGAVATWFAKDVRRRNLKAQTTFSLESRPFAGLDMVFGLDNELRLEWDDANAGTIPPLSLESVKTVDGVTTTLDRAPLRINTITPRFAYRAIDNPFDPTDGYRVSFSLQLGLPIPTMNAPAWLAWAQLLGHQEVLFLPKVEAAYYFTLARVTLAVHGRAWAGFSWADAPGQKSTLLQQDLLGLGGDRSVRGYLQDRIGVTSLPTRVQAGEDITQDGFLVVGGALANAEIRYTLIKNFFIGDLKAAAFVDAGVVTYNDWRAFDETFTQLHFDPEAPRIGVSGGVGLRYVLPVGPLSVDLGIPAPFLARGDQDPAWNIHIQLGYVF